MAKTNPGGGGDDKVTLWAAADKLRNQLDASEYKHVVLGLIFLKFVFDAFEAKHEQLEASGRAEDREFYRAKNIFWVPPRARWNFINEPQASGSIGERIDAAMAAIEDENPALRGVLPKEYGRASLDQQRLFELVRLLGKMAFEEEARRGRDVFGDVYMYFLGRFASSEGKRGGQFYTPKCVVELLVSMLAPFKGRVFDPCCGSGGMFVHSERFVEEHGGRAADLSVYGQESNAATWRLAKMNLAIRGMKGDLGATWADSLHHDLHAGLEADYILANPPFNDSDWGGERLREDPRWRFGAPPASNANFAWVQHFVAHLSRSGVAGFVLANGSMSSQQSGEGEIRRKIVEADLVDCLVALPGQLFPSTPIPVCLWILARNKKTGLGARGKRLGDRSGRVLFIDARGRGSMIDRGRRALGEQDIEDITRAYHDFRGDGTNVYRDVPGFCRAVSLGEIKKQKNVVTPGAYVGVEVAKAADEPFQETMARLARELREQKVEGARLDALIEKNLRELGYGG